MNPPKGYAAPLIELPKTGDEGVGRVRGYIAESMGSRRGAAVICFSLFSGWMLSIPFEGKSLYLLAAELGVADIGSMMPVSTLLNFAGLLLCGFVVKTAKDARRMLRVLVPTCMGGTLLLLTGAPAAWHLATSVVSLAAGMVVASWGFWFVSETPAGERFQTAAAMLIVSNVFMIAIDAIGIGLGARSGIAGSIALLGGSFVLTDRLSDRRDASATPATDEVGLAYIDRTRPLLILSIFVAIITINSGFMYSVVMPAFAHHRFLVTWYWALPYILAIATVHKLMSTGRRFAVLMYAVGAIGLSFTLFSVLDRSALAFIVIDTLMLGAFGVCDLFWWGTLGEMLERVENPAKVFGTGLSANVLGILIGRLIVWLIGTTGSGVPSTTDLATVVVIITIVSVPYLYKQLLNEMVKQEAAILESDILMGMSDEPQVPEDVLKELTDRELEILSGLLKGKTYKMISDELHISQNTTKYHVKSIYTKLGVHSKTELLTLIAPDERQKKHS